MFAGINLLKQTRPQRPTGRRAPMARPRGAQPRQRRCGRERKKTIRERQPQAEETRSESKAGRRFALFPGPQALSMPQTLTNGFHRGENVAILQQDGTIERDLPWEKGRSRLRRVRSCVMSCLEKGRDSVSFSELGMGQGTLSFSIKYPDPLFNF